MTAKPKATPTKATKATKAKPTPAATGMREMSKLMNAKAATQKSR